MPVPIDAANELAAIVGAANVRPGNDAAFRSDATETRGLAGVARAVVLPANAAEVAAVVRWCDRHDMPIVPRGGGTGYAGGAVPSPGCVVVGLERMNRIRSVDPLGWAMEAEAGVRTADVRRVAREHGLWFAPDPGAAEQSTIGGNVATNAGGPHTLKYGTTGAWVTGVEAVVLPGEVVRFGGRVRKNVAAFDIAHLLVGSEGTLGLVTAVTLRLMPPPERAIPVVATYPGRSAACAAVLAVAGSGLVPAALEFLDVATMAVARHRFPWQLPPDPASLVIAEGDGSRGEAHEVASALADVLGDAAAEVRMLEDEADARALWQWRDGVSLAVAVRHGGKAGEDVVVPIGRLAELLDAIDAIAARHGLETCSWGHAGDGNIHANFMFDPASGWEPRVAAASAELFAAVVALGGSISGEHGIGQVKLPHLALQLGAVERALLARVKHAFDPKGLLNPGKKVGQVQAGRPRDGAL